MKQEHNTRIAHHGLEEGTTTMGTIKDQPKTCVFEHLFK